MKAVRILKEELEKHQRARRALNDEKADLAAKLTKVNRQIADFDKEITNIQDGITKLQTP